MESLMNEYKNKIKKNLVSELKLKNINQTPDIEKIVINMGVGKVKDNKVYLQEAQDDLAVITGQMPYKRHAKKAISGFALRQGELVGYTVTLRGKKAWAFLEKLIKIVMPRIRDFRGVSKKAFDGSGNYSLGIREHFVFPENRWGYKRYRLFYRRLL